MTVADQQCGGGEWGAAAQGPSGDGTVAADVSLRRGSGSRRRASWTPRALALRGHQLVRLGGQLAGGLLLGELSRRTRRGAT